MMSRIRKTIEGSAVSDGFSDDLSSRGFTWNVKEVGIGAVASTSGNGMGCAPMHC